MFDRFTERAREALYRSRTAAVARGQKEMDPIHVALSLLADPKSHAVTALTALGHVPEEIRISLEAAAPKADEARPAGGAIPFSAASRRLLEAALEAAASTGSAYVGTEHLLLALLGLPGPATEILGLAGVDADRVRADISSRGENRPTGWRPGFDLGKVCSLAMRMVTEAGLDRVGRAAMVAALVEEIDPATQRALESLGVDPAAFRKALRAEIDRDASA